MTLRTRLILAIVGIAMLSLVPAVYSVKQLGRLSRIMENTQNRHAQAYLTLGQLGTSLADLKRFELSYVATPGPDLRRDREDALREAGQDLSALARGDSAVTLSLRGLMARITDEIRQTDALVAAGQPGNPQAEAQRQAATNRVREVVGPLLDDAQQALRNVSDEINHKSELDLMQAHEITDETQITTAVVMFVALILAFILGTWAARRLTRPVERLRVAMAIVAGGEFEVPSDLPYRRSDEIGDVSRSFRAMTQRLADLDRMKAEFMSIAAHELKTPINVISGYAELMEEGIYGEITPGQREALQSVHDQVEMLSELVTQLLDISRLEAGGLHLEMADVDLPVLLHDIERSFTVLSQRKGLQFRLVIGPSLPATIPADADRLRNQVLGNILSNALKFTPEGGHITVIASGEADEAVLEVSDTGPGIPADQLPHIFDKFFQVGPQARSKGAGLGLAIAREVVEAHGGTISAASEPGAGATFRVALPTTQQAPPTPPDTPEPAETLSQHNPA